jgi:hypothetical protein
MVASEYSPLQRYVHIQRHHAKYLRWMNPRPKLPWGVDTPGWVRQVWDLYHHARAGRQRGAMGWTLTTGDRFDPCESR